MSVRTSGGKGGKKLFHSEFVSDQLEQLLFFFGGGVGAQGSSLSVRSFGGKGDKKLFHSEFIPDHLEQLFFFFGGVG